MRKVAIEVHESKVMAKTYGSKLITAFTSVILVTVVHGQGESVACLSALQTLGSNAGCFGAFVSIGDAVDMGTSVPDADIATVCTTSCKTLLLDISTECDTVSYKQ